MNKKILLMLLIFFSFPFQVFASVNTCTRTSDNLYVPAKIKYNSNMKDNVLSTPCVDASEKIYDFADLFTDTEEISLYNKVNEFIQETNLDLGIVTINDNPKESAMEFADDFYDYNDFTKNGLLFLIDMDTREYYFSTTGEAIFYFDDYRVENTLDALYDDMVNANYKEAANSFIDEALNSYNLGIITSKYTFDSNGKIVRKTPWIIFGMISLVVAFIVTMILKGRNKKIKISTDADEYLNGELRLTRVEDHFLFRNTQRIYSPISSDGSSGSHGGGGSSSHSGSSGASHGGGGRRF